MHRQKIIGTLLPLFSLSQTTDASDALDHAIPFLDWLHATHQKAWQMLPLHETQLISDSPTRHVASPYKSYGIGLDPAYLSEKMKKIQPSPSQMISFVKKNDWLHDYALFCAIRDTYGTDDWTKWDPDIRDRKPAPLAKLQKDLFQQIQTYYLEQWQLHHAFLLMRKHAEEKDIRLIGDIPFYVGLKSPLVWTNQHLFHLKKGRMSIVSGVPNHERSFFGRQVWGHPLYKWEDRSLWPEIVQLWKKRLDYLSSLFHTMRIDHANGFFHYGVINVKRKKRDTFAQGPGFAVFKQIIAYCHYIRLGVYAEDVGANLFELRKSIETLHVSSIRIFRFAIDEKRDTLSRMADVPSYPANSYAYTTTHDTESLLTLLGKLTKEQKERLCEAVVVPHTTDDKKLATRFRTAIIDSPSHVILIPLQDWLLTTDRINTPGTEKEKGDRNWQYRLKIPIEKLPKKLF